MSKIIVLLLLAVVVVAYVSAGDDHILAPDVYQQKLAELKPVVLDVRTPKEYAEGHIEGATNINFYDEDFAERMKAKPKDKTYFIYCRSGGRSGKTLAMMKKAGFTIYDLKGGMIAWNKANKPVVK